MHAFLRTAIASSLLSVCTLNSAHAENLLQTYQHAKAYDPQIKALEESFKSTQESINQAQGALRPQVSLNTSLSANSSDLTGIPGNYDDSLTASYSTDLSQAVYRKDLSSAKAVAAASVLQAKSNLETQRQNLILRVAEPYFNVLLSQESLRFAEAEKEAIGKQLEQTKAYFEAGTLAITDVKEAQASYDQSVSSVISAKNDVALAKEALRVVTGKSYKQLQGNSAFKLDNPTPNNIEAWVKLAEQNNYSIKAAQQGIKVAENNLAQQRSLRKPKVDAFASHSGRFSDGISDSISINKYDNSVGIRMTMPLYTSGINSSKVRAASHDYKSSAHNAELQKQLVFQQVRSAYLTVISNISQVNSLQQALASTQTALDATQAGFEVGTRTAVDVLLALRNTFRSKRDLAQARYTYLLNMLRLKQAAGTLSANDLKQMTAMLGK
jgi:outer membrane protein